PTIHSFGSRSWATVIGFSTARRTSASRVRRSWTARGILPGWLLGISPAKCQPGLSARDANSVPEPSTGFSYHGWWFLGHLLYCHRLLPLRLCITFYYFNTNFLLF